MSTRQREKAESVWAMGLCSQRLPRTILDPWLRSRRHVLGQEGGFCPFPVLEQSCFHSEGAPISPAYLQSCSSSFSLNLGH